MSVLFMMPYMKDASGGWMAQMMENISEHISGIAVYDNAGLSLWKNSVPIHAISSREREIRYFSKMMKYFGLSLRRAKRNKNQLLRSLLEDGFYQKVFCQYGELAAKYMGVWQQTDVPLYVHFHGYDATFDLCWPNQPEQKRFANEYLDQIRALSHRATFIANSYFTKGKLVEVGISPEAIKVKYFGIPLSEKKVLHKRTTGVRILHLGRLVDFKSPDRTLQAFEMARENGLDGQLILAGDGPLRGMIELLRLRSPYKDSIHILGSVSYAVANELLATSDIFTAHNITGEITRQPECFGVSIIEAMAHGLPIVGTQHGGVVESVLDGVTGFLNASGDVETQADALLRLAEDPALRQRMGAAGRMRVAECFSPEQETKALCEIMGLKILI